MWITVGNTEIRPSNFGSLPFLENAYPFMEGPSKNGRLPKIEDLTTVSPTDLTVLWPSRTIQCAKWIKRQILHWERLGYDTRCRYIATNIQFNSPGPQWTEKTSQTFVRLYLRSAGDIRTRPRPIKSVEYPWFHQSDHGRPPTAQWEQPASSLAPPPACHSQSLSTIGQHTPITAQFSVTWLTSAGHRRRRGSWQSSW